MKNASPLSSPLISLPNRADKKSSTKHRLHNREHCCIWVSETFLSLTLSVRRSFGMVGRSVDKLVGQMVNWSFCVIICLKTEKFHFNALILLLFKGKLYIIFSSVCSTKQFDRTFGYFCWCWKMYACKIYCCLRKTLSISS